MIIAVIFTALIVVLTAGFPLPDGRNILGYLIDRIRKWNTPA